MRAQDLARSGEHLDDDGQLVVGVVPVHGDHAVEHGLALGHLLGYQLDDHPPPVGGVTLATHVAGGLQRVDHARDGPGREAGEFGELTGGERRAERLAEQQDAGPIGRVEPEPVGTGVEEHRGRVAVRAAGGEEGGGQLSATFGGGTHVTSWGIDGSGGLLEGGIWLSNITCG